MLLRFGVSNYFSIMDYQELSFIASNAIKDEGTSLLDPSGVKERIVPAVVIYGPNASGKSNFVQALRRMRGLVLNSFQHKPGAKIPRTYFAFSNAGKLEPTRFDCDVLLNGVRYHYGFEYNDAEVTREWLYSFNGGNRRSLFVRDHEFSNIKFGDYLKGKNKSVEDILKSNTLFLSAAAQANHEQLTEIYKFFESGFEIVGSSFGADAIQRDAPAVIDPRVVKFLGFADTGVVSAEVRERALEIPDDTQYAKFMEGMKSALATVIGDEEASKFGTDMKNREIRLGHQTADQGVVDLPFGRESRGTIRLVSLMGAVFRALDHGALLVIDEIDSALHTLLVTRVVELFGSDALNPMGAQLLATTHDTNLLCSGVLRRDQIWFVEKAPDGSSAIYPLTDISTRKEDNLERGYLKGRFGAIPFMGDLREVI